MQKEQSKDTVFETVEKSDVAKREEEVLAFWNKHDIFHKSLQKESPKGDFVFYDGPPFATGLPHYGHILAGTIKDAIPRFRTMQGYHVERKWGWDCHGLPLENIIEKRLGLSTKRDIEEMGIKQFNEAAREAVLEYADDWRRIIPRMGRFVDMKDDYRTMDASYTESVWWVFSELSKKGLVYEGFKSMHLCPRCGTTLSNFEVNQGYKDIKDIAVTVKLPLLDATGAVTDTSLLIWTTTPWTLPGNMAAAVHRDIEYVKVRCTLEEKSELFILAKERLAQLGTDAYEVLETMKGGDLVGKAYKPPFDTFQNREIPNKENAWKIYHADYVELGEEGTGAVHIAPAYGEEDMELAKAHAIPIAHHVDKDGRFMEFVTHFGGQLVKPKDDETSEVSHLDSDIEVVKRLKDAELLVRKENITHSYPHCWRCNTPLLNYATTSWFVKVTDMREALVEENKKVSWVPDHVGSARFGNWLEGARDWAVSRQRYWGAPIPIWRKGGSQEYVVIGSLDDLKRYTPRSGNTYYAMRHGQSVLNLKNQLNGEDGVANPLTEAGKKEIDTSLDTLKKTGVDIIYYSPLERTEESAKRVADALSIAPENLISDDRLREMRFGEFEGKQVDEYHAFFKEGKDRLFTHPEGGETWADVKKRVGEFLYEIEKVHKGKKILIVAHNGTLQMLQAAAYGTEHDMLGRIIDADTFDFKSGEVREVSFVPLPHNDNYELDFHRPYIDGFVLVDEQGSQLMRVPDVFDCWFESGSMPYAQQHYPFEGKDTFLSERFPAHFIAEGIDQTRGWFYSLLVLGVALFGTSPYKQVIVNGLTLAEDGRKMSKSLQNYPDPMDVANRLGADSMRFYLLSSPIVRGEDLNFTEKDVLELQRKNIGRLHNVLALYEMYANGTAPRTDSPHVLDRWMCARVQKLVNDVTQGYTKYELDRATRPLTEFIDDVSVWYVRRSRDRLKGDDVIAKEQALGTLRHTLRTLSLVMAPVMPFYAEYLWQRIKEDTDVESVHLAVWPTEVTFNEQSLTTMALVREYVTAALEARTKSNIKVRQPLATLTINTAFASEYADILANEVNVKQVNTNMEQAEKVTLDTVLTQELIAEGVVRDCMRSIQDMRKKEGLQSGDRITLTIETSEEGQQALEAYKEMLMKTVGATQVVFAQTEGEEITSGEFTFKLQLKKV